MVHARFTFPSRALGRAAVFYVLLPKPWSPFSDLEQAAAVGEKKCLWFFHGVGDSPEDILFHTDLAALCDELDLTVVLPAVENSFCLDVNESTRFRTYLETELIPYAYQVLALPRGREQNLIGGISMGGYGACALGLSRPDLFSRIVCLSGALDLPAAARFSRACEITLPYPLADRRAFAEHAPPAWDLRTLLDGLAKGDCPPPELLFICSELDSVYRSNRELVEHARSLAIPAALRTAPGLHDWSFWRENLRQALEWAAGAEP